MTQACAHGSFAFGLAKWGGIAPIFVRRGERIASERVRDKAGQEREAFIIRVSAIGSASQEGQMTPNLRSCTPNSKKNHLAIEPYGQIVRKPFFLLQQHAPPRRVPSSHHRVDGHQTSHK